MRQRLLIFLIAGLTVLPLLISNARLYTQVPAQGTVAKEVPAQLNFLRDELELGMASKMQGLFPEGYFFSYILYGLSWVDVGLQTPELRKKALVEARWALIHIEAPAGYAIFPKALNPPYGMFYNAWRNYLLSGILLLQDPTNLNPEEWRAFQQNCESLATAFSRANSPFLASYRGQAWPVDSFPALVSLRAYTHISGHNQYEPLISHWLESITHYLDEEMGLVPHRTAPNSGEMLDGARGTSQVLILRFLAELDPDLALRQYEHFREHYLVTHFGLTGVLEYPPTRSGQGDVDSGPLIFGVSLSATVVFMGTSRLFGDERVWKLLWQEGEFWGGALQWGEQRRYALGLLPIGDAFVVWSKVATLWLGKMPEQNYPPVVYWWWRLPYHVLSLLLIGLMTSIIKYFLTR